MHIFGRRVGSGFTLIELLVVITVLGIAGSSATLILANVFKGSNQARVSAEVKQNGQAVFDGLEKQIRNAIGVETDSSHKTMILTLHNDNSDPDFKPWLYIKCIDSDPAVSGWIGKVSKNLDTVPISDNEYDSLTNKDNIRGVDIDDCYFEAFPLTATSPALVSIRFTVNQAVGAPSRKDFVAGVEFQDTFSLRIYK